MDACDCIPGYPEGTLTATGKLSVTIEGDDGVKTVYEYPGTYGTGSCLAHDLGLTPHCEDNEKGWCSDSWCFIKDDCAKPPKDAKPSEYGVPGVLYSYEKCGNPNNFPAPLGEQNYFTNVT